MPFAGYEDWDECITKNRDKGNPEAYCGKIKHQVEDKKDTIPPECLVKAYKHYKTKFPNLSERDIYDKTFAYFRSNDTIDFIEGETLDMILLEIAQEYEKQVHDFLTTDAEGQPATHLQEQFEQLKELEESARTPEARALRRNLGGTFKPPVESIDVPFSIINSETGAVVRGYVKSNFEKNTTQLRPVSSSNVRGVGRFKDELLVQFHGNDRVARRTYRYKMGSPEMAEEAFNSLVDSGSPGRWVWENIRGHRAGEPKGIQNVPEKYGKALQPWSKTGRKVIGGTTSSLVEYNISNRVPVSRVSNFEAMSSQMKRKTSNPSKNPNTGSRIEGALESRRAARDRGRNQLGVARQVRQLPKLDFTVKDVSMAEAQEIFNRRSLKSKSMDKKIRAKKVFQTPTAEWLRYPNLSDVEGIDTPEGSGSNKPETGKLKAQGYYSIENILGMLSDLEALEIRYKNTPAILAYVDTLKDKLTQLQKAEDPQLVNLLEGGIKLSLKFLQERISEYTETTDKGKEDAQYIGTELSKINRLKEYEDDEIIKNALDRLKDLETSYQVGNIGMATLKVRTQQYVDLIQQRINNLRIDWEFLDKEAQSGIDEIDYEWHRKINKNIELTKEYIERTKQHIKKTQAKLKKVNPETGMYWKDLPGGGSKGVDEDYLNKVLKGAKKELNQEKKKLEKFELIRDLKLPEKFKLEDSKFAITGRSKNKEKNIEWLKQVHKQYLQIPVRFRNRQVSNVFFVDRCKGVFGRASSAGGTYTDSQRRIRIATNPKHRLLFSGGSVIAHEMGHDVWYRQITEKQRNEFTELWSKYRGLMYLTGDTYAASSSHEGFAEIFMEYATGGIWSNRKWINNRRINQKESNGNYPKIPKGANDQTWGVFDDYPEIKEWFHKTLGKNTNLEVK